MSPERYTRIIDIHYQNMISTKIVITKNSGEEISLQTAEKLANFELMSSHI